MASPCVVLVEGGSRRAAHKFAATIAQEAWRIEKKFSRYRDDSIVAQIHQAQGRAIQLDSESAHLLNFAQHCWRLSEQRFDISAGILRRAWHFDGSDRLANAAQIAALLPHIGWEKLQWDGQELRLAPGMEIDFGGIGKEYAVDRAFERYAAQQDRPVLINFGGDLRSNGPRLDQTPWIIGIEGVAENSAPQLSRLYAGALATSGDSRRYLQKDGQRYSHILDAKTGWPVKNAPRSVTVAAKSCSQAGFVATLAMLHGKQAEEFLQQTGLSHYCQR